MPSSLFSTFRQGENRVTATMLAVFQRLDVSRLERLLGAAMGESSLQLVTFDNQPSVHDVPGVPDGRIAGSFALWIETKTAANSVDEAQLRRHCGHFSDRNDIFERLLVITPDVDEPAVISRIGDPRVVWFSFRDLSDAIDDLMSDDAEVIAEREALLLRELQNMLEEDGLLALPQDTVVVAARTAYGEYLKYGAYLCQPNRAFRAGTRYLGFYRHKKIEPELARILKVWHDLPMSHETVEQLSEGDEFDQRVARLIQTLRDDGVRTGHSYKVMLLSPADDDDTLRRETPLRHVDSGAWTQGQRYARSDAILTAETTADL